MDIKDLNTTTDILGLFDHTQNDDAKAALRNLITLPLHTTEEVIARQDILKGFVASMKVLDAYSYSRIDYREVSVFLDTFDEKKYLPKRIKWRLRFSKKKHFEYRGKCIQVIMLYHRLHNHYIRPLDMAAFPAAYKDDIRLIDTYLGGFRTDHYERLIRSNSFRIKHIVEIFRHIAASKKSGDTIAFTKAFTLFEAFLSISQGIYRRGFSFPEIADKPLSLTGFYHPMLHTPVKNSFTATSNVILLTGPNMSGKSTLLRAIAICVYLGNMGFGIPAVKGTMPLYGDIAAFINLNDDLQGGYSHFMTEVMNLKAVALKAAGGVRCFTVFDELFRGTNIEDALDISRTTLRGLLNFPDSLFLVSSHLHQLAEMDEVASGKVAPFYLNCEFAGESPVFTYRLSPGWSDVRIGRLLFEREGIDKILERGRAGSQLP